MCRRADRVPLRSDPETHRLAHHAARMVRRLVGQVPVGINQNRLQPVEVFVFKPQQQQAGLCRNRDPDFVGDLESLAAFPILFCDEDLHALPQFVLFLHVQKAELREVVCDRLFPLGRERPGEKGPTPSASPPGKDHRCCRLFSKMGFSVPTTSANRARCCKSSRKLVLVALSVQNCPDACSCRATPS